MMEKQSWLKVLGIGLLLGLAAGLFMTMTISVLKNELHLKTRA